MLSNAELRHYRSRGRVFEGKCGLAGAVDDGALVAREGGERGVRARPRRVGFPHGCLFVGVWQN